MEKTVAFYIPSLHGGGAERVTLNLIQGLLTQGYNIDLILSEKGGEYLEYIPHGLHIISLDRKHQWQCIIPLVKYLQEKRPCILISNLRHANVAAIIASKLSLITSLKIVVVEHNSLAVKHKKISLKEKILCKIMRYIYPYADKVIGVSEGVTQDLIRKLNLNEIKVFTIYNPVISDAIFSQAQEEANHPWLKNKQGPVFLAIGRLTVQKNFQLLIRAFARIAQKTKSKLIILGEGEERMALQNQIERLGLSEDVSLPGFVNNPYAFLQKADAFVLSSNWEGLPTVLIEAMACGCSVISTDCPNGPREIIQDSSLGILVPVNDTDKLANAMKNILDYKYNKSVLIGRAMDFSGEKAVNAYIDIIFDKE